MRKLLLISAAVLGASVVASAVPAFAKGPVASAYGGPGAMPPFLGGNNMLNAQGGPLPVNPMSPSPGTVTIHLNGRVVFLMGVEGDSGTTYNSPTGAYKHSIYQQGGYFRLYPGVDGLAANGLRYGGLVEIRENMGGSSGSDTLYVRRSAVYMGTDELGILRLGQDDGPFSQMDGGVTTFQFGDGAWNGDAPGMLPGNLHISWPFWTGTGSEYTVDKIVYFSPQFAGFDLGVSYAPSQSSFKTYYSCASTTTGSVPACTTLTSAPGFDSAKARNWVEVMGRYRAKFNDVGVYAIAGYSTSGVVSNSTGLDAYDGFNVGDVGLALTYAGLRVGGNVLWGDYNRQVELKPKGGVHAISWVAGATYKTGPMLVGVQYFNQQDQGDAALAGISQESNSGLAVGGTYGVAPGLSLTAMYLYGWRHQGGYDYLAQTEGPNNNKVHMQALELTAHMSW